MSQPTTAYPPPATPTLATAYPIPVTPQPTVAYPYPVETPTNTAVPTSTPTAAAEPLPTEANEGSAESLISFLPLVHLASTSTPTATPTPSPTIIPALDFAAIQRDLSATGRNLAYAKIGYHVTHIDDVEEETLMTHLRLLDEAGVPFFLKSAGNAEPLYLAQQMMRDSDVPHTLVYRAVLSDVPNYELPAEEAAQLHWQKHRDVFPSELDPDLVWIETLNEVDKNRSQWLARFALKTAELALAEGFRWAAFGWASGEPEPEDWQSPAMLDFLRLVGNNPERLGIALHEYSFLADDIGDGYPYKVGRFQQLFQVADRYGIPRPTVLITEWGWAYDDIPPLSEAMRDARWAANLYAPFPQVRGAAIWNLGRLECCSDDLSEEVEELIPLLTEHTLTHYYVAPVPPEQAAPEPELYRP